MKLPLVKRSTHEATIARLKLSHDRAMKARETQHKEARERFRKLIERAKVFQARGSYPSTRSEDDSFVIQVMVSAHLLHYMMDNDQAMAGIMLKEFADKGYQMLMAMCGMQKVPTIPDTGGWVRLP